MKKIILSTIGTSILTNLASNELKKNIFEYANQSEGKIPQGIKSEIQNLVKEIESKIQNTSISTDEIRKWSAEINSLWNIYKYYPVDPQDKHILIPTDTYLGNVTGDLIEKFIKSYYKLNNIEILTISGLKTSDKISFHSGITKLIEKIEQYDFYEYKQSKYLIFFNLVGGFKSIQAYLTTIGMFYADKIMYIYETGEELLEIPRLPIKLDYSFIEKNFEIFALLKISTIEKEAIKERIQEIPESLIEELENKVWLSPWGILYREQFLESLIEKDFNEIQKYYKEILEIDPDEKFDKDFKSVDSTVKRKTIESLEKIYFTYIENKKDFNQTINQLKHHQGIQFDEIKTKQGFWHYRIDEKRRITCKIDKTKYKILLRKIYEDHDKAISKP